MARPPTSARAFFRDPVGAVEARSPTTGVVRFPAGPGRFVLVRDPEEAWRVLVTDAESYTGGKWKRRQRRFLGETLNMLDGDVHRRRRLLLQPALDRRRVAPFGDTIAARAERLQAGWRDGQRIHLRDELDRLSLCVAGDVLLAADLEPQAAELARALADVMSGVPRLTPPLVGTRHGRALARIDRTMTSLIAERRAGRPGGSDLLGTLVESGLPDQTVRGELIAFLLAAVDEPPSALAAAWYLLGRHEHAEARFLAELDTVVGEAVSADQIARLPYLGAVVAESLRLYPPARHVDRCPVRDVRIGGELVRAGSNVLVSPLVAHRDTRQHERPTEFVPERWLDTGWSRPARGAYVPFGAGPHSCIGEPLARAIVTLTLATIGRRWRLRLDAEPPEPVPRAPALFVTVERR